MTPESTAGNAFGADGIVALAVMFPMIGMDWEATTPSRVPVILSGVTG